MASATKLRRRATKPAPSRVVADFAPGTVEAELSAIGKSAPARAWAKVPADYFANLDHYRHGAPKKK